MRIASVAHNENARLKAVAEFNVTPGSAISNELDRVARLAATLFQVPISIVSLIERDRQLFLANIGIDIRETGRDVSFCAHAILGTKVFVVLDATLDPCFADNELVTGPPHVRFYAGAPLMGTDGHMLGTLCILDDKPRTCFSEADQSQLVELSSLVLDRLELQRLQNARSMGEARFEAVARAYPDCVIRTDENGVITFWNAACEQLFGNRAHSVIGRDIVSVVSPAIDPSSSGILEFANSSGDVLLGRTIELSVTSQDGHVFPCEFSVVERRDEGALSFECILRNVTQRRASEDRLFKLAHFDALTGLPNRLVLKARLDEIGKGSEPACVLSIDLDGFKDVNDTFGHLVGDAILTSVAQRLLDCCSPLDTVARMSGDEFVILLPGLGDPIRAAIMAERVIAAVASNFVFEGQSVNVTASVGYAIHPTFGEGSADLISNADLALYQAKAEGRHCRKMYVPALRERALQRRTQDFELRHAYENSEFELFYQPQVRLADGALLGAEALLRWRHPSRGLLSPASFLENLDGGPLAAPVGNWVLDQACRQAARWRSAGAPDFQIAINLFGAQFRANDLVDQVCAALSASRLPPHALELEITENIILRHDEEMTAPLDQLKALGVGVAFDDFGTGYASLSMLKTVPLTRLKLDQSFVRGMDQTAGDAAIVHSVLYLGKKFQLEVIAEGVETEAQRKMLLAEGCRTAQGYLFGRPMSVTEFSMAFGLLGKPTTRKSA